MQYHSTTYQIQNTAPYTRSPQLQTESAQKTTTKRHIACCRAVSQINIAKIQLAEHLTDAKRFCSVFYNAWNIVMQSWKMSNKNVYRYLYWVRYPGQFQQKNTHANIFKKILIIFHLSLFGETEFSQGRNNLTKYTYFQHEIRDFLRKYWHLCNEYWVPAFLINSQIFSWETRMLKTRKIVNQNFWDFLKKWIYSRDFFLASNIYSMFKMHTDRAVHWKIYSIYAIRLFDTGSASGSAMVDISQA